MLNCAQNGSVGQVGSIRRKMEGHVPSSALAEQIRDESAFPHKNLPSEIAVFHFLRFL
jgi:hypothetical protein